MALARAVNVGGRKLAMADLRDLALANGLADAVTLLQSGNLVFASAERSKSELEALLEREVLVRHELATDFMVRSAARWRALVSGNPFTGEARDDPSRLVAVTLKRPAVPEGEAALRAALPGRERVVVAGDVAYLVYPDGQGDSKVTAKLIERKLGAPGTARNWNTVLKIAASLG